MALKQLEGVGIWCFQHFAHFLQSLLVFLMQCNSVAQFRYIICQGHGIPKKEFLCLSCCTKNLNMVCNLVFTYRHFCLPQWLQARREMVKPFYLAFSQLQKSKRVMANELRRPKHYQMGVLEIALSHLQPKCRECSEFIQQNCVLNVSDELRSSLDNSC